MADSGFKVSGIAARAVLPSENPDLMTGTTVGSSPDKIRDAAVQFEALLVQQMLKSMWATVPTQDGLLSGSQEEGMYREMLQEALAKDIAQNASLGVADVVSRDLAAIEGRKRGALAYGAAGHNNEASPVDPASKAFEEQ